MRGVDNNYPKITQVYPYDNIQNYGRISLLDTICIKHKSSINLKLCDHQIIQNQQTRMHTFTIDMSLCQTNIFTMTLVYNDIPLFLPGCHTNCLINDIDIFVIKNNDQSINFFPNGLDTEDEKNNIERIRIYNVQHDDIYTVFIKGDNIMNDFGVMFSLVATGCFSSNGTRSTISSN